MRVLLLNDYRIDDAPQLIARGEYPPHLSWGVDQFPKDGVEIEILPFSRFGRLKRLTVKRFGDLDQQVRALSRLRTYDVMFSTTQYDSMLLAVLRSLRLYRKPLVAVMHHPLHAVLRRRWLFRLLFGGHDRLLCMSRVVRRELEDLGVEPERLESIRWGIEVSFYDRLIDPADEEPAAPRFVATGKTKRDFDTVVGAFTGLTHQLDIYCSLASAPRPDGGPNVHVHFDPSDPGQSASLTLRELVREYRRCSAVLIPLAGGDVPSGSGLSSLLEAMAMGRPIVMTRNAGIDIDVERDGIGLSVAPGDLTGWREAVSWMADHPEERRAMGARARKLAETTYDLSRFTDHLAEILKSVLRKRVSG